MYEPRACSVSTCLLGPTRSPTHPSRCTRFQLSFAAPSARTYSATPSCWHVAAAAIVTRVCSYYRCHTRMHAMLTNLQVCAIRSLTTTTGDVFAARRIFASSPSFPTSPCVLLWRRTRPHKPPVLFTPAVHSPWTAGQSPPNQKINQSLCIRPIPSKANN